MLAVSPAHRRVLESDNVEGEALLELVTFAGTQRIALGDHAIVVGGQTFNPVDDVQFNQVAEEAGVGTNRYHLTASIARKPWFVDRAGVFQIEESTVRLLFALYDPDSNAFLEPFVFFTGAGADGVYNELTISVQFRNKIGLEERETKRYVSRAHQRAIDPTDTSQDEVGKAPPQSGTPEVR